MDDRDALLAELRAQLNGILIRLDQYPEGVDLSPDEREAVAASVWVVRGYRPRSLRSMLAWLRLVKQGEEGWLVIRSVPGENRAEAWCHRELKPHLRRALTD